MVHSAAAVQKLVLLAAGSRVCHGARVLVKMGGGGGMHVCIGLVCLIAGGVGEVHGAWDDVDLPESALPQQAAVGATISTAVAAPAQPQQAQVVSGPGMAQVYVNGNPQGEDPGPKFGEEPFALTLPGMGDEEPLPSTLLLDLSGFHNARCNGVYRRMEGSNFYASETTLLYPDNPYWRLTDRSQLPLVQKPARRPAQRQRVHGVRESVVQTCGDVCVCVCVRMRACVCARVHVYAVRACVRAGVRSRVVC